MKKIKFGLLAIILISFSLAINSCKKDDDKNDPTPLSCDRTMEGTIVQGDSDYTLEMKVEGTGTYTVTKIEYIDKEGNLQTVNSPALPWNMTIVYNGTSGTSYPYKLTMYTSVTNGTITATVDGNDATSQMSKTQKCSQQSS